MTKTEVEVITVCRAAPALVCRGEAADCCGGDRAWRGGVGGGAGGWDPREPIAPLAQATVRLGAREARVCGGDGCAVCGLVEHVEVEFASGARLRITGATDGAIVSAMIKALAKGTGRRRFPSRGCGCGWRRGHTDMRKGFASLSLQVQEVLRRDPLNGHLFCFRGRRGNLLKVIWHDGQGACLFTKRLERGRFLWPSQADGVVTISPAQLSYLLSGIDWKHPQETWRPTSMG